MKQFLANTVRSEAVSYLVLSMPGDARGPGGDTPLFGLSLKAMFFSNLWPEMGFPF